MLKYYSKESEYSTDKVVMRVVYFFGELLSHSRRLGLKPPAQYMEALRAGS